MAIKAYIANKSLLSAANLNKQSSSVVGSEYPIRTAIIVDSGSDYVEIKDSVVSAKHSIIHIESAKVWWDESKYGTSVDPLYLSIDDEPGTTFRENIETFNWERLDILPTGDSSMQERVPGGPVDAFDGRLSPVCMKIGKGSSQNYAGIKINRAVDISGYSGIMVDLKISSPNQASRISIKVAENGGADYSVFDLTPVYNIFNSYYADFSNPTLIAGNPSFITAEYIEINIYTPNVSDTISEAFIANVYGVRKGASLSPTDNKIRIYATDNQNSGVSIAVREAGVWRGTSSVNIRGLSEDLFNHIKNSSIHIPENSIQAFRSAMPSSANMLITLNDIDDVKIDTLPSSESSVLSMIKSSIGRLRPDSTINSSVSIFADSVSRGPDKNMSFGSEGLIDTDQTTAIKHPGYYAGDPSSPTVIKTCTLMNTGLKSEFILVDVATNSKSMHSSITFNLDMYDPFTNTTVNALTNAELCVEHDLSAFYDSVAFIDTIPTVTLNIPQADTTDIWTGLTPFSHEIGWVSKMATSGHGIMSSVLSYNTYSKNTSGSWNTMPDSPEVTTDSHTFISSNSNGFRLISSSQDRGYIYSDANETWTYSPVRSTTDGVVMSDSFSNHMVVSDLDSYMTDDISLTSRTISHPSISGLVGMSGIMMDDAYAISKDSMELYDSTNDTWTTSVSPSDSGAGKLAFEGKGLMGSIYRYGGSNLSNDKFDTSTSSWISNSPSIMQDNTFVFGVSPLNRFEMYGETYGASIGPVSDAFIYGFAIKIAFGRITGVEKHVGYWVRDSYPEFISCTNEELLEGGFWTDPQGLIFGANGTYWGEYLSWAPGNQVDYDSATFDDKWKYGFWSDENGIIESYVDTNGELVEVQGYLWDGIDYGEINEVVWTDDTVLDSSLLNSSQISNNGYWTDDNGNIPSITGDIKGGEWSDE